MEFNIETIVTIVLGIAAIWFKVDQLFWKKAAKQAAEAMNEIKGAVDDNSPGGKQVTEVEAMKICEKVIPLFYSVFDKLKGNKLFGKILADNDGQTPKPPKG